MGRLCNAALLLGLIDKLRENGSWCGETHIQKAVYFLKNLFEVPLSFDFILYKHGPFSFELRDELTSMRADGLVKLVPQIPPYGPRLMVTEAGTELEGRFPKTLKKYKKAIDYVAKVVGEKGIVELERLATGLYVTLDLGKDSPVKDRSQKLVELKPHIPLEDVKTAIEGVDAILKEVSKETLIAA